METETQNHTDLLILGTGAFIFGYMLGTGRWDWLARRAGQLAGSLGNLALASLSLSFQEHHPDLFVEKSHTTH